jgi:hypothetical protein
MSRTTILLYPPTSSNTIYLKEQCEIPSTALPPALHTPYVSK